VRITVEPFVTWISGRPRRFGRMMVVGIDSNGSGFAVRRRWPDGSHDYIELVMTPGAAQSAIEPNRRYWQKGPWRPTEYRVVAISRNDYDLHYHRGRCQSPDCP
jgi:hypothetical protein